MINWQPIETAPEGKPVLLYFPKGERGRPAITGGQLWNKGEDAECWWGIGGPNAGYPLDETTGCYYDGPTKWASIDILLAAAEGVEPTANLTQVERPDG